MTDNDVPALCVKSETCCLHSQRNHGSQAAVAGQAQVAFDAEAAAGQFGRRSARDLSPEFQLRSIDTSIRPVDSQGGAEREGAPRAWLCRIDGGTFYLRRTRKSMSWDR